MLTPYLFYDGRCEEALEFYKQAIGVQVEMVMRYSDNPEPMPPGMLPPGAENKVMHASFRVGDSVLMASDGHCSGNTSFKGFSLSISAPDQDDRREGSAHVKCQLALSLTA